MHTLYADPVRATKLSGIRALLISDENLELLLKYYSIDEYTQFYEENFTNLPNIKDKQFKLRLPDKEAGNADRHTDN